MNPEVRKKAAIWLALVFVLGAATGGVFGYNLAHRSYAATTPKLQSDAERRAKKLTEMTQQIGLTPDQVQKADMLIAGAQAAAKQIREESEAQIDTVRMKTRNQMRALLTQEQRPKYEEYVQRVDAERKKQKEAQMGTKSGN